MKSNDSHPQILDFKKNEVQTLEHLRNRKCFRRYPDLDTKIQYTLANYKTPVQIEQNDFIFHAEVGMTIQKHPHKMYIEARIAQINGTYGEATYSLSIASKEDQNQLIRKFHFDHAHPSIKTTQPVPIFHLQYGGKLSPKMQELKLTDEKLDHWLSVPRLNYPPVNLAILLDIAFKECATEDTAKVTETSEWRNLVYKNEQFILRGYYQGVNNFFNSPNYGPKNLVRDFFYNK